ncbi:MAG: hypothetical protein AAF196_05065 [Planctomycetota bacterium]
MCGNEIRDVSLRGEVAIGDQVFEIALRVEGRKDAAVALLRGGPEDTFLALRSAGLRRVVPTGSTATGAQGAEAGDTELGPVFEQPVRAVALRGRERQFDPGYGLESGFSHALDVDCG